MKYRAHASEWVKAWARLGRALLAVFSVQVCLLSAGAALAQERAPSATAHAPVAYAAAGGAKATPSDSAALGASGSGALAARSPAASASSVPEAHVPPATGALTAPSTFAPPPASPAAPAPEPPRPAPKVLASAPTPSALVPAAPSAAAAAPSASSLVPAVAHLGEASVFALVVARANKSPEIRAREASEALQRAFTVDRNGAVSVRREGDVAVVLVGQTPIVQLTEADSEAAGESTLAVYAGGIAAKVREALDAEGNRAALKNGVFSVSLVVFFGLIAFYLIRKLGQFAETGREFLDNRPDRELSIKVRKIEVIRPATLRSSAVMAVSLGKWLGQVGIAYTWLVAALSLFEATRNYTQRLTGLVLGPASQLMERLAGALPLLVVASIAALAVFVLVRFVGLFFASVGRGETPLPWLPADLAAPTSVLLRVAIVVAALVFAAPVVTGDPNGALGRAGAIVLVALGLASTPLLASSLVGVTVLFGRRLRRGEFAEVAGTVSRIAAIDLLEIRLVDAELNELRVPHLWCLFRPLRVLGLRPRLGIDVPVAAAAPHERVRQILHDAGARCGHDAKVRLLHFDADGALYRLSALCDSLDGRRALAEAALGDLDAAGIALGRAARAVSE